MVAGAVNSDISPFRRVDIFHERLRIGAIYLFVFLMNREKALETIIVLALASILASLWFNVVWLIYLSLGFLAISLVSKRLTAVIGKGWFAFSYYLSVVMNYIIMFIIFYFFLFPFSFFQRLAGGNQILKKRKGESHFHQRRHLYSHKDIEKPW